MVEWKATVPCTERNINPHKVKHFICKLMLNLPFTGRKRNKIAQTHTWETVPLYYYEDY